MRILCRFVRHPHPNMLPLNIMCWAYVGARASPRLDDASRFGGRAVLGDELASATATALVSFKTRGVSEDKMSFAGRKDHAAAVAAAEEKVARNRRDFEAAAAEVAAVEEALAHAEAEAVDRRRKAGSKSPQRRKPTFNWAAIGTATKGMSVGGSAEGPGGRTSSLFAERSFEDELRLTAVVPQRDADQLLQPPPAAAAASTRADADVLDGIVIPAAAAEEHLSTRPGEAAKSMEELVKDSEAAFSHVRLHHNSRPLQSLLSC